MLDMGFESHMREIAAQVRPDRQTLMWTATCIPFFFFFTELMIIGPESVQVIASAFLNDPVFVTIGSLQAHATHMVKQIVEVCQDDSKPEKYTTKTCFSYQPRLTRLLKKIMDGEKILIFTDTKRTTDTLTRNLRIDGWPALSIHGGAHFCGSCFCD